MGEHRFTYKAHTKAEKKPAVAVNPAERGSQLLWQVCPGYQSGRKWRGGCTRSTIEVYQQTVFTEREIFNSQCTNNKQISVLIRCRFDCHKVKHNEVGNRHKTSETQHPPTQPSTENSVGVYTINHEHVFASSWEGKWQLRIVREKKKQKQM